MPQDTIWSKACTTAKDRFLDEINAAMLFFYCLRPRDTTFFGGSLKTMLLQGFRTTRVFPQYQSLSSGHQDGTASMIMSENLSSQASSLVSWQINKPRIEPLGHRVNYYALL